MALGNTDITTTLIRNALGETSNAVGYLCISTNINMWSRYKPVRAVGIPTDDKRWKGDAGNCGFNLPVLQTDNTYTPTNWEYLRPRGLLYSEAYRIGDFRGYEHDSTLKPPIYSYLGGATSGNNVPSTIYPTVTEPQE